MSKKIEDHVRALITKAADTPDSHDAMRFSQAACNAANAMMSLLAAGANVK